MNVRLATIVLLSLLLLRAPVISIENNSLVCDTQEWSTLSTRHFELHYPSGMEDLALRAAEIAESGYIRVANYLGHEMSRVIPVMLDPSSHVLPGCPAVQTLPGCSYPPQMRPATSLVVSFNGSYADLRKAITGGLTHVFIYSIAGEAPWHISAFNANKVPFWLAEGMARYLSRGYDSTAEMSLREMIQENRFLGLLDLSDMKGGRCGDISAEGHAFCYYLDKRYGRQALGDLVRNFLDMGYFDDALLATTGISVEEFEREWTLFLVEHYKHGSAARGAWKSLHAIDAPAGIMIPAVSPDGKKIAALSGDEERPDVAIFDVVTGRSVSIKPSRTLLRGNDCNVITPVMARDNRISWSPDGRTIVLAGRAKDRPCLLTLDAATGRIRETIPLPFSQVKDPALSPDGRRIAFSGVAGSGENIYIIDREKHSINSITADDFSDRYPIFTPDGSGVIFSTNWNTKGDPAQTGYHIQQIDMQTGRRTDLVTGGDSNIQPEFSPDGAHLIFVSDRSGLNGIYISSYASRKISRLPYPSSGAFNPRWFRGSGSFIFTRRSGLTHVIDLGTLEGTAPYDPLSSEAELSPAVYRESYVDPREYAFHPYSPHFKPGWLHLGSAGTMNNSYLCFFKAGFADLMSRHKLTIDANYMRESGINNFNANLEYNHSTGRTVLGFGLFFQGNPLAVHFLGDMTDLSPNQSFGIEGMMHYGGIFSSRFKPVNIFTISVSASAGQYEKDYHPPDVQDDLHMTYGKLSFKAEYNTMQQGLMVPVRGTRGHIFAEYALDFTGNKSYSRIGIDLRHQFLFGRQFILFLRGAGAAVVGPDNGGFQHYLGGFDSLRAYDLNSLSGRNMILFNAELRFTPVDWFTFGTPWSSGLGTIGAVLFFDAGSAWSGMYSLIDKKTGRLDDLKMDFGVGIRVAVSPLLFLKLDFAWPFDNKSIRRNDILFSIGLEF